MSCVICAAFLLRQTGGLHFDEDGLGAASRTLVLSRIHLNGGVEGADVIIKYKISADAFLVNEMS